MADIKVQTHADGIGGHQIIHIAILVQIHLRIARAGAKRAHHHRATALGAADQLGNGIDVFDGKPDNRRALRHPADLFGPGIAEFGKPWPRHELHIRNQRRDHGAHRIGPQKQRFLQAARP